MTIRDRKALKHSAKNALAYSAYPARRLFGIHIAVTAGIALVLSVLNYLLNLGIDNTGGLDGIGNRAVLQTIQQLLSTANSLALPFWQIGIVFVSLQLFRRQEVAPASLLTGFRRLGPVLRLYILKVLIVMAAVMGSTYISSTILSFSPLTDALSLLILSKLPNIESATTEDLLALLQDPAFLKEFVRAFIPMLLIMLATAFICLILILYRIRLADFVVMDHPELGARNAIKTSWKLTKGNCISLFKLDLSFWWFYGLEFLLASLYLYGLVVMVLRGAGIMTLVCDLLYCAGQVALYTWANGYLQTTYAAAYEVLLYQKAQEEAEARSMAAQTFTPWDLPPRP